MAGLIFYILYLILGSRHPGCYYRCIRDAHEAFFRPNVKAVNIKCRTKARRRVVRETLTHKQRAAMAHAHYIINHGTASDTTHFLSCERAAAISPGIFNKIYMICNSARTQSTPTTIRPPDKVDVSITNNPSIPSKDRHS